MASSVAGLVLLAAWCAEPAESATPVKLGEDTVARFATLEQGQAAITADDAFTRSLSRFDRQSRMKTADEATLDDWKHFAASHVRAWDEAAMAKVRESLERLSPKLAVYHVSLPGEVLLIRTSGEEEGNAAYTRGAAIVLPEKVLAYGRLQLDRLLLHELFHVMSRHDGALRTRLYRVIGFEPCEPIKLPRMLADRRITNPDAPLIDCTIELKTSEGQTLVGAPVLYANARQYDAERGGSMFDYLTFRLLVVEKRDGMWQPVMVGPQPAVLDPRQEPAYFEKIGKNTNYVIHPDEILADNFVRLVMDDRDLATPRIVEEMRKVLQR
jgi:hypothetical protein